jgi:nitrite reductase (NADH) large subunit
MYDFVPRIGLEEIRAVVTDERRSAELLERFRIAKAAAAARDPWLERDEPYHPRQFEDLDGAGGRTMPELVGPPEDADEGAVPALVGPPEDGER